MKRILMAGGFVVGMLATFGASNSIWQKVDDSWSGSFTDAGGRIENATLVNAMIANTNLTFAADVAFEGRTRVDFAGLDVADGDAVTVGHYEGTAPDVTLWRGRNFKTRGLKAVFGAEGGDIVATVKVPGLMLIVR